MLNETPSLPLSALTLLPHRPPMILVDQLVEFEVGQGRVSATIGANDLFVGPDGTLETVALIELVAQSYATMKGYDDLINQRSVQRGFLVGSRTFNVLRCPRVGESLMIDITTTAELDSFSVIDGVIRVGDEVIAQGSVKLWLP
ncbi:MAG: hypothetical protein JRG71_15285 [Deltaproteobacteria bacterium]|nr:hypothetical protein [Deltaproteobacteria bacterium]